MKLRFSHEANARGIAGQLGACGSSSCCCSPEALAQQCGRSGAGCLRSLLLSWLPQSCTLSWVAAATPFIRRFCPPRLPSAAVQMAAAHPGWPQSAAPSPQTARGTLPGACGHSCQTPPAAEEQLGPQPAGLASLRRSTSSRTGLASFAGHGGGASWLPCSRLISGQLPCCCWGRNIASGPQHVGLFTSELGSSETRRRELAAGTSTSLLPCTMSTRMLWRRSTRARRSAWVRWPEPCKGCGEASPQW